MEKFSLKWNDYQSNASKSFQSLRHKEDFCDVTLVGDDYKQVQAHKVILSACSPFFRYKHAFVYLYTGVYIMQNTMARGGGMVPGKKMKNEAVRNKMKKKERGKKEKRRKGKGKRRKGKGGELFFC